MQENVGGPDQNTPVEVIHQSTGFPGQEYWSGLLFPFPEYLPNPWIEPAFPALAGEFFTAGSSLATRETLKQL